MDTGALFRHAEMKQQLIGWSQRYLAALRKHLKPGGRTGGVSALRLGREAVALRLETLELARIHGRVLATLVLSDHRPVLLKRAELFFAMTNVPIEATHRAARSGRVAFVRLQKQLSCRTAELAVTNQQLQQDATRRKQMKNAPASIEKGQRRDLAESLQLQTLLRRLTHRVLAVQEDDRTKLSHELQDEIAQTLLGIQVRLLVLKHEARGDNKHLKNQIASAQQLVVRSVKSVRQFARKLNSPKQSFSDRPLTTI